LPRKVKHPSGHKAWGLQAALISLQVVAVPSEKFSQHLIYGTATPNLPPAGQSKKGTPPKWERTHPGHAPWRAANG